MTRLRTNKIWISLGANVSGAWGCPQQSLARAISELEGLGFTVLEKSPVYTTPPVGGGRQPRFLNMVIELCGSIGPTALIRLLKRLERSAGRRTQGKAAPRPLDLDILDHGGRVFGKWSRRRPHGRLILPHPEAHRRGFVLVPLAAITPWWRHPRLGASPRQLISLHPAMRRGIRQYLPSKRGSDGAAQCLRTASPDLKFAKV